MRDDMLRRIELLFALARENAEYEALCNELRMREEELGKLTSKLTDEEQDIIWGFICLSEGMNWCMLKMICDRYDIDPGRERGIDL